MQAAGIGTPEPYAYLEGDGAAYHLSAWLDDISSFNRQLLLDIGVDLRGQELYFPGFERPLLRIRGDGYIFRGGGDLPGPRIYLDRGARAVYR